MIYSGSRLEFSEFRIQAKHLKFNQNEESTNYLPFSISYYSPTVHIVQNSKALNEKLHFYLSALSFFAGSVSGTIVPDPGKSSGSATLVVCLSIVFLYCRPWWNSLPPSHRSKTQLPVSGTVSK